MLPKRDIDKDVSGGVALILTTEVLIADSPEPTPSDGDMGGMM